MKNVKRTLIFLFATMTIFILGGPLFLYSYSLSMLDSFPEKSTNSSMTETEVQSKWHQYDPESDIETINQITPYIYYKYILQELFDNSNPQRIKKKSMAGIIAIDHMRKTNQLNNTKSMFWWHILSASLEIYIERHWSAKEIVEKYNEHNS